MSFEPEIRVPRRWLRRLVVAIVAVAVIAGVAVWASSLGSGGEDPAPSATPTDEPSPTESGQDARAANGCLGGQAVNAQTVLTAQDQAPLDDIGAAEFAATINRWGGDGDDGLPPADEVPTVLDAIAAPNATDRVTGVRNAELPEERQGLPGSTVNGGYYVESSTENEVVVSILQVAREEVDEAGDPVGYSVTFTLDRSSGEWLLVDQQGTRDPNDLNSIMTPFAGGC